MSDKYNALREATLALHQFPAPGKVAMCATKPLLNQNDLSLAYSPGVAIPCLEIQKDKDKAYDYTGKGNFVAVITNGTAVLGLGNLGALAAKPVMEGKAVLFKRFADIDAVDIEVSTEDPEEFINCVRYLGASWGGINLEDIKAPECFIIEKRLKELMDIPVFHDDQHGTAIIALAALINATHITGRNFKDIRLVVNGAGAAAIACIELIKAMGVPHDQVILCDTKGVIYKGRTDGMNEWKERHAADTKARTLTEAMQGADVFLGLSCKGAVTPEMVKAMSAKPIIFAMANPDPEITPEEVKLVRDDAIMATGRSDYPNQVNNVMGFPYVFRGALDVRASDINLEMKIAAAEALAALAREHVPEEVSLAYAGSRMQFGPEYIIPVPFDPRLIYTIAPAVAAAAIKTGVAQIKTLDMDVYRQSLTARLNPSAHAMHFLYQRIRSNPKTMIFAEGEEEQVIRAALAWRDSNYGKCVLVGQPEKIIERMQAIGIDDHDDMELVSAASLDQATLDRYTESVYKKLQRQGFLYRDCARLVNRDRHIFGACLLADGKGDGLVTGITRGYARTLDRLRMIVGAADGAIMCGVSLLVSGGNSIFIADTNVHELPTSEQLAEIAIQTAKKAEHLGYTPRVAFLSYSNFGNPQSNHVDHDTAKGAIAILAARGVNFEFDGEMSVEVALSKDPRALYPFCRLQGPANILIMPGMRSANIAAKLAAKIGGCTMIGPFISGLELPVQIADIGNSASNLLNLAAFAAIEAIERGSKKG